MEVISGIYCFENTINNKKYIGYSNFIRRRKKEHLYYLRKGKHHNSYFQNAWNKYGEGSFVFKILQECPLSSCSNMEIYWIAYFNSFIDDGEGYNLTRGGENVIEISEITRLKMSNNTKGKNNPNFGKIASKETRLKISKIHLGKVITTESRKKMSESRKGTHVRRGIKTFNSETSSKYVGVHWHKRNKKWEASIKLKNKKIFLGDFDNESDAALAYDKRAIEFWGESACLNFDLEYVKNTNLPTPRELSSNFVGVCRCGSGWVSNFHFNKDHFYLGYFNNEIEAAIAYNEATLEFYGYKAKLNIISEEEYNSVMINS